MGVLHRGRALSPGLRTVAQGAQPLQRMLPYNIGLTALSRRLYLERMDAAPWAVVDERGCYIGTLEPMMLVRGVRKSWEMALNNWLRSVR